jgi:hypothetical protein
LAAWASLNTHSIVVDLATNRQPTDHAAGAGIFTVGLLCMVVIVFIHKRAWRFMGSMA